MPTAPHARSTISVEEWERKAPLTDLQNKSVNQVLKASQRTYIPLKFVEEPGSKSQPGTPTPTFARPGLANKLLQKDGSRPATPIQHGSGHALHPTHPVQTPQQFYDWFALIDRSVAHSQEAQYRAHVASIDEHLRVCELLEQRLDEIEREVDDMMENWRGVEEGGKSLKGACERLLEERDHLVELMEDIGGHLEYFQELEHATRMLNYPGETLIFQPDFLYMVERVDICIDFLKSHRHYREAEVYLLRFQQCMTRAMTLIKMNFVGSLRALSSEISKRLTDDISPTAQHHLLYTRFNSVSTRVAPLLGELERRALAYPDELTTLLSECHAAYLNTRKTLLVPRIMEEIRGLDPGKSDLVELTREGCGYLKQVCTDEWALYREFFSTGEESLYQFLETICDLLYDDLRPRILHEPRLTVLCEVCTVLQALMVLDTSTATPSSTLFSSSDASSEDEDEDEDDADASMTIGKRAAPTDDLLLSSADSRPRKVGKRLHISHLLQMVLQDAQTRLFFKAQAVIQAEIRHYVPKAEELAWPDILVSAENAKNGNEIQEKESTSQIFTNVTALQKKETWYPTLKTTVWVLSQLHDFVKPAIFEDIAQEALAYCRISLVDASDLIRSRSAPSTHLDGSLFLVRHLLILKDVITSLDELKLREEGSGHGAAEKDKRAPVSARALEYSGLGAVRDALVGGGVTETLSNMLSKTTSMLPEGLFASLGVTRTAETDMRGVKQDIDHTLRKGCEDVIAACAEPICSPIEEWSATVDSATSLTKTAAISPAGAAAAPASANVQSLRDEAPTIHLRFLEAVQRDLRSNVARVQLYLEDGRTVKILLEHVMERISYAYEHWGESIARLAVGAPKQMEVEVLNLSRLKEMFRDILGDAVVGSSGRS
ncbi:Sec34-domain-containing protein [Pholiota conissans]|uniref:Conserved oligomeric Golgi complex subunit 3 n=1 Tax=Pholiota conissans TaxID=109636 RepID=A0A9P5Z2N0_9AGAR|nr:Sec34-domain-containing protein [Pholiota conissans]